MTALSCDDLVARLEAADAPVLLLDTCTLLDVVRAPEREQVRVHDIEAVHTLIGRATRHPSEVSFVINEQVHQEFSESLDAVEAKTYTRLKATAGRFVETLQRIQALSPDDCIPDAVDLLSLGFPERSRELALRILKTSLVMVDHDNERSKALRRVQIKRPPATRAKQSAKDCLITESYLRLASTLFDRGFPRSIVFSTSNTSDYCQGHPSLHPDLREEFQSVSLEFSPTWSAARHELDRPRIHR